MQKRSPLVSVMLFFAELIGIFYIGWFLFGMIISAFASQAMIDESYETIDRIAIVSAFVIALLSVLMITFNNVRTLRESALSAYSNVDVLVTRAKALLEKANRVADKYMTHEKETQVGIAQARGATTAKIKDSFGFKAVIEAYPTLRANESIIKLLNQIEDCENRAANAKMRYNELAQTYNAALHTFPGVLVKGRKKDLGYYVEQQEEISDAELGI